MNIGSKIKELRGSKTQEVLAREVGIQPMHLSKIERGRIRSPRFDTLEKIAKVLGVTVTELIQ